MADWQKLVIIFYIIINLFVFTKGYKECHFKKNAFGLINRLAPVGIFCWGDALIIGFFWIAVSIFSLFINNWFLFCLIVSIFWVVRSFGETIYWFNQQFSSINRNPPETLLFKSIFHNDSVWFAYQIIWQCVTVISTVASIYFAKMWLS